MQLAMHVEMKEAANRGGFTLGTASSHDVQLQVRESI
jgi:hypothetical protein